MEIFYQPAKCQILILNAKVPIGQWQCLNTKTKSKLGFYVPFDSQGHIRTGSKYCRLWESKIHRGDCLWLDAKLASHKATVYLGNTACVKYGSLA